VKLERATYAAYERAASMAKWRAKMGGAGGEGEASGLLVGIGEGASEQLTGERPSFTTRSQPRTVPL
jgi:hypothetical protein